MRAHLFTALLFTLGCTQEKPRPVPPAPPPMPAKDAPPSLSAVSGDSQDVSEQFRRFSVCSMMDRIDRQIDDLIDPDMKRDETESDDILEAVGWDQPYLNGQDMLRLAASARPLTGAMAEDSRLWGTFVRARGRVVRYEEDRVFTQQTHVVLQVDDKAVLIFAHFYPVKESHIKWKNEERLEPSSMRFIPYRPGDVMEFYGYLAFPGRINTGAVAAMFAVKPGSIEKVLAARRSSPGG